MLRIDGMVTITYEKMSEYICVNLAEMEIRSHSPGTRMVSTLLLTISFFLYRNLSHSSPHKLKQLPMHLYDTLILYDKCKHWRYQLMKNDSFRDNDHIL